MCNKQLPMNPKSHLWSACGVLNPAPRGSDIRNSAVCFLKAGVHVMVLLQIEYLEVYTLEVTTFGH